MEAERQSRSGGTVLVLGGGGARGFAHFGVLKVLEDAGIRVDRVVGVSIGAFVGAMYCQEPDVDAITERVRSYVESEEFVKHYGSMTRASRQATPNRRNGNNGDDAAIEQDGIDEGEENASGGWFGRLKDYFKASVAFHRVVTRISILSSKPMLDCLRACVGDEPIERLEIPLTIVAVDLRTGARVQMESGDLYSAVLGSTALPGIFPPIERDGRLLADYGVLCSIPVATAMRYRPETIIAVDLTPELLPREEFASGLDVINRMEEIGAFLFKEHVSEFADVIIRPAVSHVDWADFANVGQIIDAGVVAAEAVLPTLLKVRTHRIAKPR